MLDNNNAARLREGVKNLETMTRFALAVLALASGVYTLILACVAFLMGPQIWFLPPPLFTR